MKCLASSLLKCRNYSALMKLTRPKSIMVSVACLKEVNRLRDMYRKDLPLYVLPLKPKKGTKRKLTGTTHPDQPKAKKGIPTSKTKKTKKGTLTSKKAPP